MTSRRQATDIELAWCDRIPDDWAIWTGHTAGAWFSMQRGWLESFVATWPHQPLQILTARRQGSLVGALPLVLLRRLGRTWIHSLPFGTHGGPLVCPEDRDATRVHTSLAQALGEWLAERRISGGELVHAPAQPSDSPLPEWQELSHRVTAGETHVIDLAPGAEAILRGLEREPRRELRHADRVGVRVAEEPGALNDVYALYREQARAWRGHKPYPLMFLRRLIEHTSGFARLFTARLDSRVQAGVLALSGGGETFIWWSGAAPETRRTLAVPRLYMHVMQWAAETGQRRFNMGSSGANRGLVHFKEDFGASPHRLWIYHVRPQRVDLVTRLYETLRAARRRV